MLNDFMTLSFLMRLPKLRLFLAVARESRIRNWFHRQLGSPESEHLLFWLLKKALEYG
jgi:hypothetical protein